MLAERVLPCEKMRAGKTFYLVADLFRHLRLRSGNAERRSSDRIVNGNVIMHNSGEEKMHDSGEKSLWVSFK